MRLAPGSPFASERNFPPQIEEKLNETYGLNNPWYIQYKDYLIDTATFNFGESMKYKARSTNDMISESFPVIYSILPALAIAFSHMGFIAKLTRSSMLEQNNSDYVKMARAKGIGKWTIVFRHTLRNALLPVVTYLGPLTAGVVTGSFIVEQIFAIPGLGKHFVQSITNRDYTVIMGTTVFYSIILLFAVLIVDILYSVIDPRIKLKGAKK